MAPGTESGKPVQFRRVLREAAAAPAPGPPAPAHAKHVLRGQVEPGGEAPPHVEYFGEEDVDGFKSDRPRWVAFCPDCGAKLALEEHEACPFFGGPEVDRAGFVVAVHCGLRKAPPR
jgi:hypothetical protein